MSQRACMKWLWLLPLFTVTLNGQQSPPLPVDNTVDTGTINGAPTAADPGNISTFQGSAENQGYYVFALPR